MAEPALFQHCDEVYKAMVEEAELRTIEGVEGCLVYEGFLTRLVTKLRLPNPYYTFVTNALQEMDCIQQLKRGGGSTPSVWLIKQPPTMELYDSKSDTSHSRRGDRIAALEQQVRDLNRRLSVLEKIA